MASNHSEQSILAFIQSVRSRRAETIPDLLSFADREDYLAWRTAWKRCYAQLTHDIRATKAMMKDHEAGSDAQSAAQAKRHHLRGIARKAIEVRQAGKVASAAARGKVQAAA